MDKTKLADTDEFFKHHKTPAAVVQATAGLVGTYLSPMGAKTLHSTHKLDRPARRLSQSTRLFMGMGDNDAFGPKSKLLPTCQKVRLVHAAIRQLHLRSGKWDVEGDGMPVSLLYTAATPGASPADTDPQLSAVPTSGLPHFVPLSYSTTSDCKPFKWTAKAEEILDKIRAITAHMEGSSECHRD